MIIRTTTFIDLEIADKEAGEDACTDLTLGLVSALDNFPYEVLGTEIDRFHEMDEQEINLAGHDEI
jgi:hypothetical protein